MNKSSVSRLQRNLRQIQFEREKTATLPIDGIYGAETEQEVKNVQNAAGFPPTGEADADTWNLIEEIARDLRESAAQSQGLVIYPIGTDSITMGESGAAVLLINIIFDTLHSVFPNLPQVTSRNTYGNDTADAAAMLQQINGFNITGLTDKRTFNALARLYNRYGGETK